MAVTRPLHVTLQAFDKVNAHRREKMGLMHRFVASRRLPSELKLGMTRYVDSMFAFSSAIEGAERIAQLPPQLRSALLECIHKQTLDSCKLLQTCRRETALAICTMLQPQVGR